MDGEFNKEIKEFNKPIDEYKVFDAVESFSVGETQNPPLEQQEYKEDSSEDTKVKKNIKEEIDRINDLSKTDVNEINQANSSELNNIDTLTTASESTAANVVSSSTTLVGGITVISAAAVVTVGMGGSIFDPPVEVKSCKLEAGTDYLIYEIDIDKLNDGANCVIRVTSGRFVVEFPISDVGIQKQLVTGLTPQNTYTVSVVGDFGVFKDNVYFHEDCYTLTDKTPTALFDFSPSVDYENYVYNLNYDIYFSNYYNSATNPSLEIYVEDTLVIEDFELDEESFFRGTLEDLYDMQEVSAKVYGDIEGEKTLISEYGYKTEYPEDFDSYRNVFSSKYEFSEDNVTYEYDVEKGNIINIDANFVKGLDRNDCLRFDIYNEDELIKSIISDDGIESLEIDPAYKEIKIVLTELKLKDNEYIEYNTKEIENVFETKFSNISTYFFDSGINFNAFYNDEISNANFDVLITKNYLDGTSFTDTFSNETEEIALELLFDDNYKLSDLESIEVVISNNTIKLYKNKIYPNKITFSDLDVSDTGSILLGYEISELDGLTFDSAMVNFYDGASLEESVTDLTGEIEIETLNKNLLNGRIDIIYKDKFNDEISISTEIINEDLGAKVEVESYVFYTNSECFYNLDFITTLNGKEINMDLDIITDKIVSDGTGTFTIEDSPISEANKETGFDSRFYSISVPRSASLFDPSVTMDQIKYIINTEGFDNSVVTLSLDGSIADDYETGSADRNQFEINDKVNYLKETSLDGKVIYHFDTGFVDNSSNGDGMYQRIFYSYTVDGVKKYGYTPYFTDSNYALELDDYEYTFEYGVFYCSNGIYYQNKTNAHCVELNLDSEAVFISSSDVLVKQDTDTYIEFTLDYSLMSKENSIDVTYNDVTYTIPFKRIDDEDVESDGDEYYGYSSETNKYQYQVSVELYNVYDSRFTVRLTLFDVDFVLDDVKLNLTYDPSTYYGKYGLTVDESEIKEVEISICDFKTDVSDLTYSLDFESASDYEYKLLPTVNDFKPLDERETYRFEYYYNDELVATDYYNPYGSSTTYITKIYDKLDVKLVYYKEYVEYGSQDYLIIDAGSIELDTSKFINEVELSIIDSNYSFSATGIDGVNVSKIEYEITYDDGQVVTNETSDPVANFAEDSTISSVKFNVYFMTSNYVTLLGATYKYDKSDLDAITFGSYSLDNDGNVLLEYTNNTGDITSLMYQELEIEPGETGEISITDLDSNEIVFTITREYVDSYGNNVKLTYNKSKVFEIEIETDYMYTTTYVSGAVFQGDAPAVSFKATPTLLGEEINLSGWEIVFSKCGGSSNPNELSTTTITPSNLYSTVIMYINAEDADNVLYELEYHYVLPNGDILDNNGSEYQISILKDATTAHTASGNLSSDANFTYSVTRNQDDTINIAISDFRNDNTIALTEGEYFIVELRYTENSTTNTIRYEVHDTSYTISNIEDRSYKIYVYFMYDDGTNSYILSSTNYNNINTAVTSYYQYTAQDDSLGAQFFVLSSFVESNTFTLTANGESISVEAPESDISGTINDQVSYKIYYLSYNDSHQICIYGLSEGDVASITISEGNSDGNYKEKTYSVTMTQE